MSDSGPIDLADLQLKPQWVDELDQPNRFEAFEKREARAPRGNPKPGGGGGGGDRRPGGGPRGRGGPGSGGSPGDRPRRPQGDRRQGDRRQGDRKPGDRRSGPGGERRSFQRGGERSRRDGQERRGPDRPPLYELLDIDLSPDRVGLEAVAKQIKMTGRSYPVFDLARLALGGPERYHARFTLKPETKQVQLVECKLDGSLWLSMNEAVRHVRNTALFDDFYRKEQVEVDPPKGNFSVVAVCGLSGALLGPPNFHSYQKNISDLHHRKFSRMHIDGYKRRIQMVRDEETIEKWKNSLTKETHFTYLKGAEGADPVVFKSIAEAERHFSENHGSEVFVSVPASTVPGTIPTKKISGALHNMMKRAVERQTRFPMPMVKNISPVLEKAGLRFFKIGRKETFVARSRPRALNPNTEISPRIRAIVQYIRENEKQDLNKLVTALVPNASTQEGKEPTPEEIEFLKDLRWLVREGFVIEFSSGELRLGVSRGPLPQASKTKGKSKGSPAESGARKPAPKKEESGAIPPGAPAASSESGFISGDRLQAIKDKRRLARRAFWRDAMTTSLAEKRLRRLRVTQAGGSAPTRAERRRTRKR